MRRTKYVLLALALVLAVLMTALFGAYGWYRVNHLKINGEIFDIRADRLDLRDREISEKQYKTYCRLLPNTEVLWSIPFQGQRYDPATTTEITVTTLQESDFAMLDYLPNLKKLDASECRDYEAIYAFQRYRPDCEVEYYIHMGDDRLDVRIQTLLVNKGDATITELRGAMQQLTNLTAIHFEDPDISAEDIALLAAEYPQITVTWNKPLAGVNYPITLKEAELSKVKVRNLEEIETWASYYPDLDRLIFENCRFSNDEMAAFRERARGKYEVIWGVYIGKRILRTDAIGFIPSNSGWFVSDEDLNNLKYCEGLQAVDLGHTGRHNLSWVSGTPHLKYLIMGESNVFNEDLAHLSCLKELEYLEIFRAPVSDVKPLQECTALKDLLLSSTGVRDVEPLTKMTQLEHLWLVNNNMGLNTKEYLQSKLPRTVIEVAGDSDHGRGWRKIPRYFEMRDTLGMWYMTA